MPTEYPKNVSVVIPLYNGAPYIMRSVLSVLEQTYRNFELIVVDDGSTDNGADLLGTFNDARLRVIRQANAGVSAARNKGIHDAVAPLIAFLDADDAWDPNFLEAVVALSAVYPAAGIYGTGYRMVFPRGPVVEVTAEEYQTRAGPLLVKDYFRRASGGALINASGVMVPRHILRRLGGFTVGEQYGEDLEMWARIALHYDIAYDMRILFTFFQTPTAQKPRFKCPMNHAPHIKALETHLTATPKHPSGEMIRACIEHEYRKFCVALLASGGRSSALLFVNSSSASQYIPLLCWILRSRLLWPMLLVLALGNRLAYCRLALRATCGARIQNGISQRLR